MRLAVQRTFIDDHPEMQHLVRELMMLRKHNQRSDVTQNELLLYAEGAVAYVALERLLRILPAVKGSKGDTLTHLLRKAHDNGVIVIRTTNLQKAVNKIAKVRDTTLHANYEQAAAQAGMDVPNYFKTQYTPEIDRIGGLFLGLLENVHHISGSMVIVPTLEVPIP
jgi:hypothetical protein